MCVGQTRESCALLVTSASAAFRVDQGHYKIAGLMGRLGRGGEGMEGVWWGSVGGRTAILPWWL